MKSFFEFRRNIYGLSGFFRFPALPFHTLSTRGISFVAWGNKPLAGCYRCGFRQGRFFICKTCKNTIQSKSEMIKMARNIVMAGIVRTYHFQTGHHF